MFGGRANREAAIREAQQIVKDVEVQSEVSALVHTGHDRYEQLRTPPTVALLDDFRARYADYCAVMEAALDDVPSTIVPDRGTHLRRVAAGDCSASRRAHAENRGLAGDLASVSQNSGQISDYSAKERFLMKMGLGKTIQGPVGGDGSSPAR